MRWRLAPFLINAVACGAGAPAPSSSPAETPAVASTTKADASAPAPSAALAVSESPPPAVAIDAVFPTHEDACQVDGDCAAAEFSVASESLCCSGCGGVAGTRAWVGEAEAICAKRRAVHQVGACPPDVCPKPVARCEAGRCAMGT